MGGYAGGACARRGMLALAALIVASSFVACGGNGDSTVTVRERIVTERSPASGEELGSGPAEDGPRLGDHCNAESSISSEVEAQIVEGIVRCSEAKRIMELYFANAPNNGAGSGGGLDVAGWRCISAPPPEEPLAGYCENRQARSKFEIYSVGWAFRPENQDLDCQLPPPDGAGQYNLRATNIDCEAAFIILGSWESVCSGRGASESCEVGEGVRCRIDQLGIELSEIRCYGRQDQLVTFETGA